MTSKWSIYLVFAIALAEGALLVAYELPMWRDRIDNLPSPQEATVVRVVAEQFAWNVHYPGPTAASGALIFSSSRPTIRSASIAATPTRKMTTAINQLMVPVDHPVLIHPTSKDVIQLHGLRDARETGRHSRC